MNLVSDDPLQKISTPSPTRSLAVTDRSFQLANFQVPLFHWNTIDETYTIPGHSNIADSAILSEAYSVNGSIISGYDYCQSETYFSQYRDELLELFKFRGDIYLLKETLEWEQKLLPDDRKTTTVAIHIRRGDFIRINATIPISYYLTAVTKLFDKLGDSEKMSFFIFSDDIKYINETFLPTLLTFRDFSANHIYVVSDPTKLSGLEEFYLLSKCMHFIIPSSTFSWWAAYLGMGENKVVYAPHLREDFIKFLYPSGARQEFYLFMYKHIHYPSGWNLIEPTWEDLDNPVGTTTETIV